MHLIRIIFGFAVIATVGLVTPAAGQSQYCLPLQMELAALNKSAPRAASNNRAIREELSKAKSQERNAGCRSFFSRNRSSNTCRSLRSRISSLERQLRGSRRGGIFRLGQSADERQRQRIIQALARAGCSQRTTTYRTICVRVCDGYYYPLSITSSQQRFQQDAQKCAGQYPPGEGVLYYHPFPGGDASQAVSLSGDRYFDQAYAFSYRTSFQPYCAARLQEGLAALRERVYSAVPTLGQHFEQAIETRIAALSVSIPIARADWSSDPETIANRAGDFIPTPVAPPSDTMAIAGGGLRKVGDPYYFPETNPGPPATVAGYEPPELKDFRLPQRASVLPVSR